MSMTAQMKEQIALPALSGGLLPISVNGQTNSGTIDMSKYNRAQFLVSLGLGVATGNINLQQTANANGAGATNISGATIAYTANSAVYGLEVRADQLTSRYVKCNLVTDGACIASIIGEGAIPRFQPVSDNTSVVSRVAANV